MCQASRRIASKILKDKVLLKSVKKIETNLSINEGLTPVFVPQRGAQRHNAKRNLHFKNSLFKKEILL